MNTLHLRRTIYLALLLFFCTLIGTAQGAKMLKGQVVFTRSGIVIELAESGSKTKQSSPRVTLESETESIPVTGQWIDDKRFFLRFAWEPQASYHIGLQWGADRQFEADVTSPFKPIPYRIRVIELDDLLSLLENLQRPAKATTVTFSPNAKQLAIATDTGHLAIVQSLTGQLIWKTRISEGYAKHATFSPDGKRFYIGEQSADGFIYAYDLSPAKPKLLWKYRTADDIDTSIPKDANDVYAWVQYPGPYRIATTDNGDVFVAGVHSWNQNGVSRKKSQFYRFAGETGNLKWKWPSTQAIPMVIRWFDFSRDGKTIALVCDTTEPDMSSEFRSGTLYVINGETGQLRWEYTFEPLKPYFEKVTFWRGLGVSPDGNFINLTTDDGRGFIFNVGKAEPIWRSDLTTPLEVSGIPITATAGMIAATNDFALFVTGDTFIPYHLQRGAQQPPSAHPNGMTLFAYSWAGEKMWQWTLENMPQGLRVDAAGQYAAVSVSKRSGNVEEQLHGVSVFDLTTDGGGLAKYLYTYRTEGQLPYDTIDMSADGRLIAVIERPIKMADETVRGKNRVHVIQ